MRKVVLPSKLLREQPAALALTTQEGTMVEKVAPETTEPKWTIALMTHTEIAIGVSESETASTTTPMPI